MRVPALLTSERSGAPKLGPCIACVLILATACSGPRKEIAERFDRYMAASNAHDLAALASMTHDDIVWRFGPFEFRGKEEALRPNGSDLGLNTTLEVMEAVVRGDTVDAVVIERNDATRAYGPDSLVHYARYVFRDGLVWRKSAYRPSQTMSDFQLRGEPFRQWARETYPERSRFLFGNPEEGVFGVEPGRELSRLLGEWVDADRPGQNH